MKLRMPRKSNIGGRGALMIIALMLFASGVVRFGGGTGAAIARELDELNDKSASSAPRVCAPDAEIADILDALMLREEQLVEREAALADRLQALALAETEIDENLTALVAAEDALKATISQANTAAENDLSKLTAVYENMKPQQASLLFQQMTPEFAAGFLGRMRADAAAAILSGLEPEAAYTISVILAGRNALVPTE